MRFRTARDRKALHSQFATRWADHQHRVSMWVEMHELNDDGEYAAVSTVGFGLGRLDFDRCFLLHRVSYPTATQRFRSRAQTC